MKRLLCALAAFLVAVQLQAQPVIPDYDRGAWGRWMPTEETGNNDCRWDSRHRLLRDVGRETNAATLTTREESGKACRVLTLTLVDRYTGDRHTGPANKIDIDHLVPLAEAHRSGGWAWDREKRIAFWNDPENMVAVHERVNASKADVDPGGESQRGQRSQGWWPPDDTQRCWYAQQWIYIKTKWGLSFDASEVESLIAETRSCWREMRPITERCRTAIGYLAGVLDGEPGLTLAEAGSVVAVLEACALSQP